MGWTDSLRVPYGPALDGYWGPPTSTLNFCEEDYVLSRYAAELCNTATNLIFLWLGMKGVKNCLDYNHPTIYLVSFVGYLAVGMGSVLFHSTLKYPMQLVDELSMIYTTCLVCFAAFSFNRTNVFNFLQAIFLVALAGFITIYYHITQNPLFHQVAYAILTVIAMARCLWVMETTIRPRLATSDNRYDHIVREMWLMVATGASVFLAGFVIWNLDNIFCSSIRRWRREVGLPWAVVLEGHGWWHLMTGMAYYYIVWGIWMRRCLEGRVDDFVLSWSSIFFSIPEVRSRTSKVPRKEE